MNLKIVVVLCALFVTPGAQAFQDEAGNQEANNKSMTAFAAVSKIFNEKMAAFAKKYEAAESREAKTKVFRTDYPKPASFFPQMLKVAQDHPKTKGAFAALGWIVNNDQSGKLSGTVLPMIARDFPNQEGIGDLCLGITRNESLATRDFLKHIIEASDNKTTKGRAIFALAKWTSHAAKTLKRLTGKNKSAAEITAKRAGEKTVAFLKETGTKKLRMEALTLFKQVESKFADVPYYRDTKIGTWAKSAIFEMTKLNIGQEAPDITAEDIDGVEFSLSDYKGKVVVLDFWGNW